MKNKNRIQLSENFFLDEFELSATAIRLDIDTTIAVGSPLHQRAERLANDILQPARFMLGPIHISSGYRPLALNRVLNGADNSQHIDCLATDITASNCAPFELAVWLRDNTPFDQLILEYQRWVHVSIAKNHGTPRGSILTAHKVKSGHKTKPHYLPGILTKNDIRRLKP